MHDQRDQQNSRMISVRQYNTRRGGLVFSVATRTKLKEGLSNQCRAHLVLVGQVLGVAVPVAGATAS